MPPVRYAAAYGACGERRSKPNIKAVCSAQRVSELFVLQDLVWLVGRSESCSPGLRTGVGSQAATCPEIGRASCRERVCQYVYVSVVAVSIKTKKHKITF